MKNELKRTAIAILPLLVLVVLLALDISVFGADSILGASQVALLTAAGICVLLSVLFYKTPWKEFEGAVSSYVGDLATAILILLMIGAVSGTWTVSGVVPAFICYGIKIISPKVFLLTACILCAIVSVMTGSSWTTIATVGVALIGIGKAEGFSEAITAGAIISGAYFGDKISPLSDTTVLASSVNGVPLFSHIRYMMLTTVPSFTITLIVFTILGLAHDGSSAGEMQMYSEVLSSRFRITPWLMLVPLVTFFMIWKKMPAVAVLALGSLAAVIASVLFQGDLIREIGAAVTEGGKGRIMFAGVVESIYNSIPIETGNEQVNELVSSRGMIGMLNT
ncbi:MAG: sodium:proton antiporter, partial [Bacteroidales bacterium]|nr:sodium:proton antiporter [Bacteroidales bacterium]